VPWLCGCALSPCGELTLVFTAGGRAAIDSNGFGKTDPHPELGSL
jgi:hypothetical protein